MWHDADDGDVTVNVAAQKRLRKLRKNEDEVVVGGSNFEERLREVREDMFCTGYVLL